MRRKKQFLILIALFISMQMFAQNPDNRVNNLVSSWVGNSFPGGDKWVQHNIIKAQVYANGEIHVYSTWDEAHQEGAKYQGVQNPDGSWYGDKIGYQSEPDAYNNVKGDKVTIDGVEWYIDGYTDTENVNTPGRTDRRGIKVIKTGTSIEITDLEKATSLGIDRKNNLLMITDDGPTRHTVRFYDTNGQFVKQLGIPGGIWPEQVGGNPAMNGVIDSDLKFWDLVGCGSDAAGNIIVVMSDIWKQSGAVIKAFNPAGTEMLWELHGDPFCEVADFDRQYDGTVINAPKYTYQIDYSKPTGKQYTKTAYTLNPYKYPTDWRLTDGSKNNTSSMVRYVGGKKFLYYTGMYAGLSIYKFNSATDGEIAIPSQLINAPGGKNHLDVDDNGDYYELLFDLQKIRKTPAEGVDANGDIIWGTKVMYNKPSEFEIIAACCYVGGPEDEMLVGGFFPGDADQLGWKQVGRRMAKYKNWNSSPTLVWSHHFTEWYHNDAQPVGKRRITKSIQSIGDYVFVDWMNYNYNGTNRQDSPGVIDVFSLKSGEKVGEIFSGTETMTQSSWHDLLISFHVMKRSNGKYLILGEENWKSKHLLFDWCPTGDCNETADTQTPTVPTNLAPTNITGSSFTLSWIASTDNVVVSGYEVFANGVSKGTTASTSMSVTGLTCNTAYSMTVKARDAVGNWSAASATLAVSTSICDTEVPTAPTSLSTSNITETSFTLSWIASTDNVGVKDYEVFVNGVSKGTTASTSLSVMGLTCATSYSMTVKGTDAAGNSSAASTAMNVTTSNCIAIDPTMMVWWKLDETSGTIANDATGNNRSGSLLNGWEFTGEAGIIGKALTSDGIDDVCRYNQLPGVSAYPFTLSAWVKTTNSTEYDQVVYLGDGSTSSKYFTIGIRYGKAFICARNTTEYRTEAIEVISDGQWHLITGVFESETSRNLYVDGSLKVTGTNSVSIIATINRFSAGALDRSSLANQYGGSIDDVRLYGKALNASEVSEIFLRPTGLKEQYGFLQSLDLKVYPNPLSEGNLTLTTGFETTNAGVMVFDINGKLIFKNIYSGMTSEIPGRIFEKGVYIISVQTDKGNYKQSFIRN